MSDIPQKQANNSHWQVALVLMCIQLAVAYTVLSARAVLPPAAQRLSSTRGRSSISVIPGMTTSSVLVAYNAQATTFSSTAATSAESSILPQEHAAAPSSSSNATISSSVENTSATSSDTTVQTGSDTSTTSTSSAPAPSSSSAVSTNKRLLLDEHAVPISGDDIWNQCFRGLFPIQPNGRPYDCDHFHANQVWSYPEIPELEFFWDRPRNQAPVLTLPNTIDVFMADQPYNGSELTIVKTAPEVPPSSSSSTAPVMRSVISGTNLASFPVDALGIPLSTDNIWNECIRNHQPLDAQGRPFNCSRYHIDNIWKQPDMQDMYFSWDTSLEDVPLLMLPPGYQPTLQGTPYAGNSINAMTASVDSSSSSSSEDSAPVRKPFVAEGTGPFLVFPVDEHGVPLSNNPIWNECIRNHVPINAAGQRIRTCGTFHNDHMWKHPDDPTLEFQWIYTHTPAVLSIPKGYQPMLDGKPYTGTDVIILSE